MDEVSDVRRLLEDTLEAHPLVNRYDEMWECLCGAGEPYPNVAGPSHEAHQAAMVEEALGVEQVECPRCGGRGTRHDATGWKGGMSELLSLPLIDCPVCGGRGSLVVWRGLVGSISAAW